MIVVRSGIPDGKVYRKSVIVAVMSAALGFVPADPLSRDRLYMSPLTYRVWLALEFING